MNVIAIIPARKGSKGVPGKNSMMVDGKPLISYTIEAALQSKMLSRIWVSTDDPAIITVAEKYENIFIHNRDESMASDYSQIADTVKAILGVSDCDAVLLLQPTAPIRTGDDIDIAINLLISSPAANTVISVVAMNDIHPARMYWKEEDHLVPILPEFEQIRRQDIKPAYYRNGSIYLIRKNAFDKEHSMMVKPIVPYIMPLGWLLNIDEPRDKIIAEALIPAWKKGLLG